MISEEQINQVKYKIVSEFDPDKIILFGSYAYGTPTDTSDLDLLIVKDSTQSVREMKSFINRLFLKRDFSLDVVVAKPNDIEEWKSVPAAFLTGIIKRGKTIYEKF